MVNGAKQFKENADSALLLYTEVYQMVLQKTKNGETKEALKHALTLIDEMIVYTHRRNNAFINLMKSQDALITLAIENGYYKPNKENDQKRQT